MNLIPAYGRNYNTASEALEDWANGKDFKIYGGPYCSIRDKVQLEEYGPITIYWAYPYNAEHAKVID